MNKKDISSGFVSVQQQGFVFLSFWFILVVIFRFITPIYNQIFHILPCRAEYQFTEQFSKFLIFIELLICSYTYSRLKNPLRIKTCICFLLISLAMYLGESNMLREIGQVIFGVLLIFYLFRLIIKQQAWLILGYFLVGCFWITMGEICDYINDHESIRQLLTQPMINFFSFFDEECCDSIGQGFLCLTVIAYFVEHLKDLVRSKKLATLLLGVSSVLLSFGNGFMHYQYYPGYRTLTIALLMSIAGYMGLMFVERVLFRKNLFSLFSREFFYLLIFTFFILLPPVFGRSDIVVAIVLWGPALIFFGKLLYYYHPAVKKDLDKTLSLMKS